MVTCAHNQLSRGYCHQLSKMENFRTVFSRKPRSTESQLFSTKRISKKWTSIIFQVYLNSYVFHHTHHTHSDTDIYIYIYTYRHIHVYIYILQHITAIIFHNSPHPTDPAPNAVRPCRSRFPKGASSHSSSAQRDALPAAAATWRAVSPWLSAVLGRVKLMAIENGH